MSARTALSGAVARDDWVVRAGRWIIAKIWVGGVLSGAYVVGHHVGWSRGLLVVGAVLGAIVLSLAAVWLPRWTNEPLTGRLADVVVRVAVWVGLLAWVVAALLSNPGVGAVAGGLFLTTADRTFRRHLAPVVRRLRRVAPLWIPRPGRDPAATARRRPPGDDRSMVAG